MTSFRGKPRELVHLVKYGYRKELGRLIGRAMGEYFPAVGDAILVPVPLHKESKRTFNQSMELAKGMSDVWGTEVRNALEWRTPRPSQVGLPSGERKKMPYDSIGSKGPLSGRVFIIDDVCTTGATLRCAIRAATEAGGVVAGAFAWARTPE